VTGSDLMNLETLVATRQIHDLQVTYSMALDARRYDDLDDVFVPDVAADYGHAGQLRGVSEVKDACRIALDPLTSSQHHNGNHWARVDGDTAQAGCTFISSLRRDGTAGGDLYQMGGRYDDELVRTPGGWRISKRTLTVLWAEGNPRVRFDRP